MYGHHDSPIMRTAFHANAAEPVDPLSLRYAWQYLRVADATARRPRPRRGASQILALLRLLVSAKGPRR